MSTEETERTALLYKYAQDQLTPSELVVLRSLYEATPEGEKLLAQDLDRLWAEGKVSEAEPPAGLFERVDRQRTAHRPLARRAMWWVGAAASVAIGVLGWTSFRLYQHVERYEAIEVEVATARGERSRVVLPDGSWVRLNPQSSLRYSPSDFAAGRRTVSFAGDAYFSVEADSLRPFEVQAQGARVRVVGTKFWLSDRPTDSLARLVLEEGSVAFGAVGRLGGRMLEPGQHAVLNKTTGEVRLEACAVNSHGAVDLVFRAAALDEVARVVGAHYGVRINVSDRIPTRADLFTGSVPTDNLFDALTVIERAYGIESQRVNIDITLSDPKSTRR